MILIGREALRGLLARRGITFQRTKTWKESPDPDREAKLDRIEEVLHRFPDRVFAFDEFGPLGIRPTAGSGWAARKRPDRLPATYHRTHGIRYFHGCYDLAQDRLWGITRLHKGGKYTLAALKSIRAARPDDKPIYVILDNLSANKTPAIRAWADTVPLNPARVPPGHVDDGRLAAAQQRLAAHAADGVAGLEHLAGTTP